MIVENLQTLKIHKLTEAQYQRTLSEGNIDPNALYLTPDESLIIDNTLSISGAAADAKVTGDAIESLRTSTDSLNELIEGLGEKDALLLDNIQSIESIMLTNEDVDTTLTIEGAAADAKAVSEAIGNIDAVSLQAVDNNVTAQNYSTVLPDLDTANINRVYAINNCLQDIQHIPDTTATSGTLLYYNGDASRRDNQNKSFGVQILTATDHKTYLRSCWAGTWAEWEELSNAELIGKVGDLEDRASALEGSGLFAGGNVTASNYSSVLPDLNTAHINRVYAINGCLQSIANIPNTGSPNGTLLYYNGDASRQDNTNKSFGTQILTTGRREYYIRSCWGGTWTEWSVMASKSGMIQAAGNVSTSTYTTVLPDLNTADINRVYAINGCLQNIDNIPDTTATSGTLIYYNGDASRQDNANKSFGVQILTATDHKTYLRSCWAGTWTEWGEISGKDDGQVSNIVPNYANFSVFDRFGTIGDSLSVGCYRQSDGTDATDETKSWAYHIAKNCHNNWLSLGFGGATTTTWIDGVNWTDNNLEKALLSENECGAYIIALGYNDCNTTSSSGGVALGSLEDIDADNPDNNAVSYYGNMDKILRKLHATYPDAKLFVLNNPYYNTSLAESYNTALSEVAARLTGSNVYLIDLYKKYNKVYSSLIGDREANHYHPQIYQYMGMMIATAISDYMLDNFEEFKYTRDLGFNNDNYELIETVEITEESVSAINLYHDLDKLILYINCPIASATVNCGIDVYKSDVLAGYAWLSNMAITSSARVGCFEARNENGLVVCENTTPQNDVERKSNTAVYRKAWRVDGKGAFTRIRIFGGSGAAFPIGTVFELWGVKA